MKKNAIGHMVAQKQPASEKLRGWNILPKFICLLLALTVWLAITNLVATGEGELASESETETVEL